MKALTIILTMLVMLSIQPNQAECSPKAQIVKHLEVAQEWEKGASRAVKSASEVLDTALQMEGSLAKSSMLAKESLALTDNAHAYLMLSVEAITVSLRLLLDFKGRVKVYHRLRDRVNNVLSRVQVTYTKNQLIRLKANALVERLSK